MKIVDMVVRYSTWVMAGLVLLIAGMIAFMLLTPPVSDHVSAQQVIAPQVASLPTIAPTHAPTVAPTVTATPEPTNTPAPTSTPTARATAAPTHTPDPSASKQFGQPGQTNVPTARLVNSGKNTGGPPTATPIGFVASPTPTRTPFVIPTLAPVAVRVGAICRDGSRSSATGRGACSHHGGVAQWLYK